ncbi:MAG TPA: diguanylate cyclase [Alphaproteobacteria bacterium]|nr:diguanylate cyclase [Alphaproteobacteria bacterium]
MRIAAKERNGVSTTLARVIVSCADGGQMRALAARLSACGYVTLSVPPGAAALRLVREARPDLVVVGAEEDSARAVALAEGIKQSTETRHIPIAVLVRQASPTLRRACLAVGIDDVITGAVPDPVLTARLAPLFRLATMTGELTRRRDTLRVMGLAGSSAGSVTLDTRPASVLIMASGAAQGEGPAIGRALAEDCVLSYSPDPFSVAEALNGNRFDALVLLPDSDIERALHLCSHIRNNPRLFNLPVLLVADRASFDDPTIPYRRGASLVLTRPFDAAELRDQVQSLVRRQRLRQAVRDALAAMLDERTRDPETGLYAQAFLAAHLSRLVADAGLSQKPLSVVLLEIQNIAWFERQFGPAAGARVLGQVARWLQGLVRIEDLAAHVKDARFAIVLPDTGEDDALVVANRIAGVLLHTNFMVEDAPDADALRVWVEAGTAMAEPGDTVDSLLARAHSRLR